MTVELIKPPLAPSKLARRKEILFHAGVIRYHVKQIVPDMLPTEAIQPHQAMARWAELFQISLEKYLESRNDQQESQPTDNAAADSDRPSNDGGAAGPSKAD